MSVFSDKGVPFPFGRHSPCFVSLPKISPLRQDEHADSHPISKNLPVVRFFGHVTIWSL